MLELIVQVARPFPLIIEVLRKRILQRWRRWRIQRQRQFVLMRVWHDRKRYQSAEETAALDPATGGGSNPRGYPNRGREGRAATSPEPGS